MKKYYKLFPSLIPVKGYLRSLLLDPSRDNFYFIPNDLHEIISKDFIDVDKLYEEHPDDIAIIDEYIQFLTKNELLFEVSLDDEPFFPKLNKNWETPFQITNMVIDIGNYEIQKDKFSFEIGKLGVNTLEIRVFDLKYLEYTDHFISFLSKENRVNRLKNIQINISVNNQSLSRLQRKIILMLATKPIISGITIFSLNTLLQLENEKIHIIEKNVLNEKDCGVIDNNISFLTRNLIFESMSYNSCLNCKLSIDSDGNIKNCPSMSRSFGKINDKNLDEITQAPDFKKYWNISKDSIEVCKDCEFRYICTDCRAYTERTHVDKNNFDLSKPLKCSYDPYTGNLNPWTKDESKKNSIEFYNLNNL
ncbi:grasp-with-spasm system SPASM domain peptide maturase [uncultured Chryseobacterium sp.]|uniref:grasp-with-spasm system SPASM domain peptide maturase n=1 Tax=uncultured Chryseobacterium sp. TaxID=259322 RepID=UPI0025F13F53|nr:grasp-with-spasm system SPASM domain peptide maturase [uncultured Chryseobacterium sp.]